jgi:hypothetical protein
MNKTRVPSIILIAAMSLTQFIGCSSKDKGTTPTQTVVEMSGTVSFPNLATAELSGVTVGFGDYESSLDTTGAFRIQGNGHVVGVAMAYDEQQTPMLMSVCPDPSANANLEINAHSTAIALAFLNPFICIADPSHAQEVIERLEGLPELMDLEDLITAKLSADPSALGIEDAEIDANLSELVLAYFNSYPEEVGERVAAVSGALSGSTPKLATSPLEIDPNYSKSGLRLTWDGGSSYKITNSYGRWCYCCTPADTFFVFPNGDLLDWIRSDRPFPPSERRFNMDVVAGEDTSWVELYGYGFSTIPSNLWDNLSHTEKKYVHAGGITTVTMELFIPAISAICNVPRTFGNEKVAQLWSSTGWNFVLDNAKIVQRLEQYIKANNPTGASIWLCKQIMSQAATSADYRAFLASTIGLSLTGNMVSTLGRIVKIPFTALIATYNLTSVAKTMLALSNANFATNFKVWREFEDFGSVAGQVASKTSGNGIAGASVTLAGDEGNPLNPAHQVTTDGQGHYRFDKIGVGEKTITANKTGYNSNTVTATIVKDQTVTANIELEAPIAGLTGRVLNEILVRNGVSQTGFTGTVNIEANEIGGQHRNAGTHAYDGNYSISLSAGNWWVVATHEDYKADSFSIAITGGTAPPPRDLVLKPDPQMTGKVHINTDNQGGYEMTFDLNLTAVGLFKPSLYQSECHYGGAPQTIMSAAGIRGNSNSDNDWFEIDFDTVLINGSGDYRAGGGDYFGCSGTSAPTMAAFGTTRQHCLYAQTVQYPMSYLIWDDARDFGCNCGASLTQTVTITQWGTELADIVAGHCVIDLAGWKTCECSGSDTNHDGIIDHWNVSCSQAMVEIDFRLLVGTDYLITFRPNGSGVLPGVLRQVSEAPSR